MLYSQFLRRSSIASFEQAVLKSFTEFFQPRSFPRKTNNRVLIHDCLSSVDISVDH